MKCCKKYSDKKKIKVIYFPIDDKKKINEILNKIKLKLLVLVETELWPNLINEVNKKNSRIIVVMVEFQIEAIQDIKNLNFY